MWCFSVLLCVSVLTWPVWIDVLSITSVKLISPSERVQEVSSASSSVGGLAVCSLTDSMHFSAHLNNCSCVCPFRRPAYPPTYLLLHGRPSRATCIYVLSRQSCTQGYFVFTAFYQLLVCMIRVLFLYCYLIWLYLSPFLSGYCCK